MFLILILYSVYCIYLYPLLKFIHAVPHSLSQFACSPLTSFYSRDPDLACCHPLLGELMFVSLFECLIFLDSWPSPSMPVMCPPKVPSCPEAMVLSGGTPPPPFLPQPGDTVLARWTEDHCFYRAKLLEFKGPVYCLLYFYHYGLGLSRYDELNGGLIYLPVNCLIDKYLQRKVAHILKMQKEDPPLP